MSHTPVVYSHPYDKSFSHVILEVTVAGLGKAGKKHKVIDLYAGSFDPSYSTKELSLYKGGRAADLLVTKYQRLVDGADSLIVLSPI